MNQTRPNFLIVGAAKAGTTALYYYLKQHCEIGFPELKEPKYFSSLNLSFPHKGPGDMSVDKYVIKKKRNYLNLFKNLNEFKRIGEASPDYLFYHKNTAPVIKEFLGDIPIVIVLRNPVKRAFSAYMYLKRDSRESLSFSDALDAEENRLANNWDFIWGYKKGGLYYEQVKTFINTFSNVKIIFQEDLKSNTNIILKEIYRFLDVDSEFQADVSIEHNPSGIPKNMFSKLILSRKNIFSSQFREFLKLVIPRKFLENIARRTLVKNKINIDDENLLKKYFREDIVNLEKLINKKISQWL